MNTATYEPPARWVDTATTAPARSLKPHQTRWPANEPGRYTAPPGRRYTITKRTSSITRRMTPGDRLIAEADWLDLADMLKNADSAAHRTQLTTHIVKCRNVAALPDQVLKHMAMIPAGLNWTTATLGMSYTYTNMHNTDAYHRRIWRYLQEQLANNGIDIPDGTPPTNQPTGWSYPAQTNTNGTKQTHHVWHMFKQLADSDATIGEVAQLICTLETSQPANHTDSKTAGGGAAPDGETANTEQEHVTEQTADATAAGWLPEQDQAAQ